MTCNFTLSADFTSTRDNEVYVVNAPMDYPSPLGALDDAQI